MINSFYRYIDRLAESLLSKLEIAQKLAITKSELQSKREELNKNIKETYHRLETIKKQTLFLRAKIENALSTLFNGRPVNILLDASKL
jgi:uncharacterized protein involved in exopolysaccharide biosynthesis